MMATVNCKFALFLKEAKCDEVETLTANIHFYEHYRNHLISENNLSKIRNCNIDTECDYIAMF